MGYDDTELGPNKHFWKILNSWGITSGRPKGIFKVKMNQNYDNIDGTYFEPNLYMEPLDVSSNPAPTLTASATATPSAGPVDTPAANPTPTATTSPVQASRTGPYGTISTEPVRLEFR